MTEEAYSTVGWDAIEQAVVAIYGEQEPKHYGTLISYRLGGNDPLDGISAYKAELPVPHWHFVTYGLSELYEKENENQAYSGYGFELTFRLARAPEEDEPPAWSLNLLQNIARYVFQSGNVLESGHYLDANGPICLAADTDLTALAFVEDRELGVIQTPNGQVTFVQMVGISSDEMASMQVWNTLGMLTVIESYMPGYVTDLTRKSTAAIPEVAAAVALGIEQDGSSTGFLYTDKLEWEAGKKKLLGSTPAQLTIGAKQAPMIGQLLLGRLRKEKALTLSGSERFVQFEAAPACGIVEEEQGVRLLLSEEAIDELAAGLLPKAGVVRLKSWKDLQIQIDRTEIKDQEGRIVETIG